MKLVKLVFTLLLLLGVALGLLIYNVGPLSKAGVEKVGPTIVNTPVTIGNVVMNWSDAEVALSDLLIGNPEGYVKEHLLAMGSVTVQLDTATLLSDEIHIKQILIDSPIVNYEQKLSENNISRVLDNVRSRKTSESSGAATSRQQVSGKRVVIDHLMISNGGVYASSELTGSKEQYVSLKEIELHDVGKDGENGVEVVVEKVLSEIQRSVLAELSAAIISHRSKDTDVEGKKKKADGNNGTDKVRKEIESGMESAKETLNETIGELKKLLSR
ncbi:MAG: AsmA family protein [Desulfobulbaceae bacterium]|nr:AsmA family protein [Desulfobulbaceae bacterium]